MATEGLSPGLAGRIAQELQDAAGEETAGSSEVLLEEGTVIGTRTEAAVSRSVASRATAPRRGQ
jgi:hypothetical protein